MNNENINNEFVQEGVEEVIETAKTNTDIYKYGVAVVIGGVLVKGTELAYKKGIKPLYNKFKNRKKADKTEETQKDKEEK